MKLSTNCIAVVAVAIGFLQPVVCQSDTTEKKPGVIERAVKQAKEQGLSIVTLSAPVSLPTGVNTMETIAGRFSMIVAQPLATSVVADARGLTTWYTLQVDEVLLHQPTVTSPDFGPPTSLAPVPGPNQLLLPVSGGEARVDGVAVRQLGLQLRTGTKYMLVVLLRTGRLAELAAQEGGVFEIDAEGQLQPLKPAGRLAQEVNGRWGNRFDSVSWFLRDRDHGVAK